MDGGDGYDLLTLISEMSQAFAESLDIGATLRHGLARIAESVGAEAASLFVVEGNDIVCHACFGPVEITGLRLPLGYGIVGRSIAEAKTVAVDDVRADQNFGGHVDSMTGFITRSLLCAPMCTAGRTLGAIELINKRAPGTVAPAPAPTVMPGMTMTGVARPSAAAGAAGAPVHSAAFTVQDQRALRALAAAAALSLENARNAKALIEHNRLERELELAADLQRSLLPGPRTGAFPVSGITLPGRVISGDFFDILPLDDGRIAFAVADVAGKGMNAALLMAKTCGLFRLLAGHGLPPGRVLAKINDDLCGSLVYGLFVAMIAGLYDPATGRLRLVNAGYVPPVAVFPGVLRVLATDLPPLGVLPGGGGVEGYPETELDLSGGSLYLVSDSVVRLAVDTGGVGSGDDRGCPRLGLEGLLPLLHGLDGLDTQERLSLLLDRLPAAEQAGDDDLTLMVVGQSGP